MVHHGDMEEDGVTCEDCFYFRNEKKRDIIEEGYWGWCYCYPQEIKKYIQEWCGEWKIRKNK